MTFCRAGFKARKHPSSVSLKFPLRFLSPYQEAVCASSTRGRRFSSARQKPLRSVDLGKQDPNSKLLVKNFYREEKFLGLPPSGAGRSIRWGQPMSSSWEEQTPPKHFEESLRNSKTLRNWSDESLKSSSYFQTIFRSVCLDLLIDLLQTAESSKFKVLPFELDADWNRLNCRSLFLSFRSITDSFY